MFQQCAGEFVVRHQFATESLGERGRNGLTHLGAGFQVGLAMVCRELIFAVGFPGHHEKQKIGQLGDVLVVSDAIILEDVAQIPELGDDVGGSHSFSVLMN